MATTEQTTHVIQGGAVYNLEGAQNALGLTRTTLKREVRMGRLRVSKRAGRYFLLGEWLLEWLRKGEVRRRKPEPVEPSVN